MTSWVDIAKKPVKNKNVNKVSFYDEGPFRDGNVDDNYIVRINNTSWTIRYNEELFNSNDRIKFYHICLDKLLNLANNNAILIHNQYATYNQLHILLKTWDYNISPLYIHINIKKIKLPFLATLNCIYKIISDSDKILSVI